VFTLSIALGRTPKDALCPWRRRDSDKPVGGGVGHYAAPDRATAEAAGTLILLAEDNPTNQTVIRMLMDRLGLVADLAADGREGLSLFETRHYGLVITDCHMPDMDGYELTERIRARETGLGAAARTPIVALTADAIAGTAKLCLDRGMDDYLTKPVAIADLEAAVARWLPRALDLRRPRPAGPPPPGPGADDSAADPEDDASAGTDTGTDATAPPGAGATGAGAGEPVLDTAYMLELVGGDAAMLKGLLEEFVESTGPDVAATVAALTDRRMEAAQKAAHAVSGAARSAGALRLGAVCKSIEQAVMAGDHEAAVALTAAVQPAFDEAVAAIRSL
jgi:CheY-like chemotaxis protein/HPt (histidine-containing phosphotransfer) domain-containing protein